MSCSSQGSVQKRGEEEVGQRAEADAAAEEAKLPRRKRGKTLLMNMTLNNMVLQSCMSILADFIVPKDPGTGEFTLSAFQWRSLNSCPDMGPDMVCQDLSEDFVSFGRPRLIRTLVALPFYNSCDTQLQHAHAFLLARSLGFGKQPP